MTILRMYTDGGCRGNQSDTNAGGWGCILEFGEHKKEIFGGEMNTTNNRMELTAVIEGFRALNRDGQTVEVFSDSAYVSNCFREKWYESWEKNKWRNAAKKSVENQDLWKELLSLVNLNSKSTNTDALYQKFAGWNGNRFSYDDFVYVTEMNNRADELANMGMDRVIERSQG